MSDGSVKHNRTLMAAIVAIALAVIVAFYAGGTDTPGERFRAAIKQRERLCGIEPPKPGNTSCDILKLVPEQGTSTPEGRYAQAIKLPPAPTEEIFRRGMTSEEYFNALCTKRAGEYIYRVADNVEGVVQLRPRRIATDYMLQHLYAMEDPFGYVTEGDADYSKHGLVRPTRYRYVDRPVSHYDDQVNASRFVRILGVERDPQGNQYKRLVETRPMSVARYGFTWRGITDLNARELGIAGSELIILDVESGEILAIRRGYIRSGDSRNSFGGIWWTGGHICPTPGGRAEYYTYEFLTKVLRPAKHLSAGGAHVN